ncbi:MAG: hypothetical protein QOF68_1569 [Gaiellales bacterium]|jgi:DUF218 domain|nr:hypothetical protein [Gaiellales bacterium]
MRHDRWALLIPGSGRFDGGGRYLIGPRALRCLAVGARLADRRAPQLILLSGWSPVGGASEAHQMHDAWPGRRDVEIVVEPTASITAENMSRSLPLLLDRGIEDVTVVCGALHLPRVRYFFGSVYPRHGIRCRYAVTRQLPTPGTLAWEAAAYMVARGQRRAALAELRALSEAARRELV